MVSMIKPLASLAPHVMPSPLLTLNSNARTPPKFLGIKMVDGPLPQPLESNTPVFRTYLIEPRRMSAPSHRSKPIAVMSTDAAKENAAGRKLTPADIRASAAMYQMETAAQGGRAGSRKAVTPAKVNLLA